MGPDSDPDVVADSSLRVLQIKQLRVSDASIMPLVPSVNMRAEKTADLVKETWSAS
jgi:choline dehydrogenase-like flavoprotein